MTRIALFDVSIARALPNLALVLGLLSGCSGEAPSASAEDSAVVQDQLTWPGFCGGHDARTCSPNQLCVPFLSLGCSTTDHVGVCVPRPEHCSAISDPVCGCDGTTYSNICDAAMAGTAIVHHGSCSPPPSCHDGGSACPGAGQCSDRDDDHHHGPFWWSPLGHPSHGGVCECTATVQCASGQRFNDDPSVCACESNGDPCASVTCKSGQVCVAQSDGTGACQADPCGSVTCKTGQVCVVQSGGAAACEDDPCASITCKTGQVCVAQSDGTASCQ